ncbi:MAG: hypothetical protein ACRC2K_14210 [Clostridium sp.]
MEKFLMIGLVFCGVMLFLMQLLNYYIHIGRNKSKIKNRILSFAPSTKAILLFTLLYWAALIWMFIIKIDTLILLILLFVCVQFTFAVFLTSNLYLFDDYLLVPWNPVEFSKINSIDIEKVKNRNKLSINYSGRMFSMSLKDKDLNILLDAIQAKKKIKVTYK